MKKMILLIPIGLLATTGVFWIATAEKNSPPPKSIESALPKGPQALFTYSEHSLRQIIRHGNQSSIITLQKTLDAIDAELTKNKERGFNIDKTQAMFSEYKKNSQFISDTFAPFTPKLKEYDRFEQTHEKAFMTALDQIGLRELKTAYTELEKLRLEYIKTPTNEEKIAYTEQYNKLKIMISELYLDTAIDKPLYTYLDNHNLYFKTIDTAYSSIGFENILKLQKNTYAIKAELQLLQTL